MRAADATSGIESHHFALELLVRTGQLNAGILVREDLPPLTVFGTWNFGTWNFGA
jgi:hypothetical protein